MYSHRNGVRLGPYRPLDHLRILNHVQILIQLLPFKRQSLRRCILAHRQLETGVMITQFDFPGLLTHGTGKARFFFEPLAQKENARKKAELFFLPQVCAEIAAFPLWNVVLEAEPLAGRSGHEDMSTGNELSRQVHDRAGTPAIAPSIGVAKGIFMGLSECAQRAESGVAAHTPIVQTGEQTRAPGA